MSCIFCMIANKSVPKEFLYENEHAFVIKPLEGLAPHHVLVIPKKHIASLAEATSLHLITDIPTLFELASAYTHATGIDKTGFRVVFNSGPDSHQAVQHLHMHVIGGARLKPEIA